MHEPNSPIVCALLAIRMENKPATVMCSTKTKSAVAVTDYRWTSHWGPSVPKRRSSASSRRQRITFAPRSVWHHFSLFSLQVGAPSPSPKRSHGTPAR